MQRQTSCELRHQRSTRNSSITQPACVWIESDFPDLPNDNSPSKLDCILIGYANLRRRLLAQKGRSGGLWKITFIAVTLACDVAFVGYAIHVRKLANLDDITLIWVSVLFWIMCLWILAKQLEIRHRSWFTRFKTSCFSKASSYQTCLRQGNYMLWARCTKDGEHAAHLKKRLKAVYVSIYLKKSMISKISISMSENSLINNLS